MGPRLSKNKQKLETITNIFPSYLNGKRRDCKDAIKVKPFLGTDSLTVFFPAEGFPSAVLRFGRLSTIYKKKQTERRVKIKGAASPDGVEPTDCWEKLHPSSERVREQAGTEVE